MVHCRIPAAEAAGFSHKTHASSYAAPGRRLKRLVSIILLVSLVSGCMNLGQFAVTPATPIPLPTPTVQPSQRGAGGTLHLISWDAPTTLNPHLSTGNKDFEASRIVYEPLASFDADGQMVPFLADEIPSLANGDVAQDGLSVTWRLKKGVTWSDGSDFTAEDVLFTYEFITNPSIDISSVSTAAYAQVSHIDIVDAHTLTIYFKHPNAAWYIPFVGIPGLILPHHIFADYNGENYQDAPANMGRQDGDTVGTGPYRVVSFKPQETLFLATRLVPTNKIVYEPNPYFREPDKPFFARVELLGGRAPSQASRSVLTSDAAEQADYAFDLQESAESLQSFIDLGQGRSHVNRGSGLILLDLNHSDPTQDSRLDAPHPFFSDKRVRQAFAYAIDRATIARELYGQLGDPAYRIVVAPETFQSPNTFYGYDPERANELLDEAGWSVTDEEGIRERDGQPLRIIYEAPVNYLPLQRLVREQLRAIGVDVEIKTVDAGIFLGNDQSHPDSSGRFLADLQTYLISMDTIDPVYYLGWWKCDQIPQEENNWLAGINVSRWCNSTFDTLHQQATEEIDEQKRHQMITEMNDLFIEDVVTIPLVHVADMSASRNELEGVDLTPWDADVWQIKDWKRSSAP